MRSLIAASVSWTCFVFVVSGTFVPLRDPSGLEYLFVWAGAARLMVLSSVGVAALAALFLIVRAAVRRRGVPHGAVKWSDQWLAPMSLLGIAVLGIVPAAPGIGEYGAPVAHFFYDLRWWWFAVVVGWTAFRVDRLLGQPVGRRIRGVAQWSSASRLLALDTMLFAGTVGWAIVTTPHLRFDGVLHGDEPKYIRYCEVWYQGGGFEISRKRLFTDRPLDDTPAVFKSIGSMAVAIGEESRELAADLRRWAAGPRGFRWNRASGGDGFVRGKHGGIYQVYQPGLSAILFPGYFLDRYLFGLRAGHQAEFPLELIFTNVTMLLIYGGCAVALFRLLRHALASDGLAVAWAAVGALMLPTTAFAFQLYPELPALGIVLCLTTYGWFHARRSGLLTAGSAGALAGALAWLHPRFLLLSACLTVLAVSRTGPAGRRAVLAAYALMVLTVMAFDYRVTGSWSPTALWDVNSTVAFNPPGLRFNLLGYALHRTWGLLPLTPLLTLALPGLAVLARTSWKHAAFIALTVLSLVVPASAHTLHAAGGTPGRLVLAVIPLCIWPIAVLVRRFWSSVGVRTAALLAVGLSLAQALAYNRNHLKNVGPMHDPSMSGWKLNLAGPFIPGDVVWATSTPNYLLFLAVMALMGGASVGVFVWSRRTPSPRRVSGSRTWLIACVVVLLVVTASILSTAVNATWTRGDYLVEDVTARRSAARALVSLDRCRICFASREGPVDWRWLQPNGARDVHVNVGVERLGTILDVTVESDGQAVGFGRVKVDFGDGSAVDWNGIVGAARYEHRYRAAGTYRVLTWFRLRDGQLRMNRQSVTVAP